MIKNIKKLLRVVGIVGVTASGIFGGYKGCSYFVQEIKEQERSVDNPYAYNYTGFIDNEYVTFNKFLSPQATLIIERPCGRTTIYKTFNERGQNLNIEAVYIYNKDTLEKKVDLESEEGISEIWSIRQKEFNDYLLKIYKIKYPKE